MRELPIPGDSHNSILTNLKVWASELVSEYTTNRIDSVQKILESVSYIPYMTPGELLSNYNTVWIAVGIGIWTLIENDIRKARARYISSEYPAPSS